MKTIFPIKATLAKAITSQTNGEVVRVFLLGLFDSSIDPKDILEIIEKENLSVKFSSSGSAYSKPIITFEFIDITKEEIVYDNLDEFVHHAKVGIFYQDVVSLYKEENK